MNEWDNSKKIDISILYAEDEDITRLGISEFLKMNAANVYTARNGEEALIMYYQNHPDIIITDIRMPVMGGIELIQKIKNQNKDIPVIITTAYNDVELLIQMIDIGVNQFLVKPIDNDRLLESIQKCLRSFTLEKELVSIANLLSEYKNAIDYSSIVYKFDREGKITYVNEAFCRLSGYDTDYLIGKNIADLGGNSGILAKEILNDGLSGKNWKGIIQIQNKDDHFYYLSTTIVPISSMFNKSEEFMTIGYEVTELIEKQKELRYQLYTDRMTQLPNRTKLLEDVEKAFHPILFLINIDSFQQINDFYGNEVGDHIIKETGLRIKAALPSPEYRLYKMPADEFAILLDKQLDYPEMEAFLTTMREEINDNPYTFHDNPIHITAAVGIAISEDSEGNKGLLAVKWHNLALKADMALKKAKRKQKNYIVYDESLQISKEYEKHIHWTRNLKDAIRTDSIFPFYQPIQNNSNSTIDKYECLVRLKDNQNKIQSPILFLETAKRSKLYYNITKIMLEKSINTFKNTHYEFSINLSVDDILDEDTNLFIKEKINQNLAIADRMVFEILESEGIENYEEVIRFIEEVKKFKCRVAIDDFGTGYSNFAHILRLNVDYIKIDASLTRFVHQDANTRVIMETIVNFSRRLGIKTIAEFVFCKEVQDILLDIGVDFSQGYFIGEPKSELLK